MGRRATEAREHAFAARLQTLQVGQQARFGPPLVGNDVAAIGEGVLPAGLGLLCGVGRGGLAKCKQRQNARNNDRLRHPRYLLLEPHPTNGSAVLHSL